MKLKNVLLAGLASSALLSGSVFAASWSVSPFSSTAYSGIASNQIEDFEGFSVGTWTNGTSTNVGTFSALNEPGTGNGSTCKSTSGGVGGCTELAITDYDVNGQGNLLPDGLVNGKALQANDTFGMIWEASLSQGVFNEILFGIRDAADQGATVTISLLALNNQNLATPITRILSGRNNNERLLVGLSLMGVAQSATISIVSSKTDDSFTFDGGALYTDSTDISRLNPVPLPAAAWLFLSALGGASVLRRVRGKA